MMFDFHLKQWQLTHSSTCLQAEVITYLTAWGFRLKKNEH